MERQVFRSLAGGGISDEARVPTRLDVAQRCDRETVGLGGGVGQQQAGEVHGSRAWVEEFDEVIPRREPGAREPLIDADGARIARDERRVACAERRSAEPPQVVVSAPDGAVGQLKTEGDGVEQRSAAGGGVGEDEVIAGGLEAKAEVDAGLVGEGIGEEDEERARLQRASGGERELAWCRRGIAQ